MGRPNEAIQRNIYFGQELDNTIKLIKSGLVFLQRNKLYKQNQFVYLLLLSNGLERLFKIVLYLHVLDTESRHLSISDFKRIGHDLESLINEIKSRCFTQPYIQKPFAADDLEFLENDNDFLRMLHILSEFARKDRYIYMDGISDPSSFRESPEMLWEEFQRDTLPSQDLPTTLAEECVEQYADKMNQSAVIYIEKLLRAVARLFIFNVLGSQGRQYSIWMKEFSKHNDNDLGTTIYEF